MKFTWLMVLLFSLILSGSLTAHAGIESAESSEVTLLKVMRQASKNLSYRGVFIYTRGDVVSTMSIVHRKTADQEQERLVQLDGDKSEIIRKGSDVVCIFPDSRVVSLAQSTPIGKVSNAFRDFTPNLEYYMVSLAGSGRVAGRSATKISVMAKDDYRYNFMLWVDDETNLLLKSLLTDAKGKVLERFQYTSLEYVSSFDDKEFESNIVGKAVSHKQVPATKNVRDWSSKMTWNIQWKPSGFELMSGTKKQSHVKVYTDGLATFSIFIEEPNPGNMPQGGSRMGATVAYARELKWNGNPYMVTVVGEVPPLTAMKVAESIVPKRL